MIVLKVGEVVTGECLATFTCDAAAFCGSISDVCTSIAAGDILGHVHFINLEESKQKG
jgi:hypothetical protein